MEIVAQEKWTWGTTDFVPVMTKLNAASPDIIWAMVSGQANDQLKAARQLGFKGVFVSNSPLGADVFQVTVQDPAALTDVMCNSVDVTHPTPEIQRTHGRLEGEMAERPLHLGRRPRVRHALGDGPGHAEGRNDRRGDGRGDHGRHDATPATSRHCTGRATSAAWTASA